MGTETGLVNVKPGPVAFDPEYIGRYHDVVTCFLVADHCGTFIADVANPGIKEADLALVRIGKNASPAFENGFSADQLRPPRVQANRVSLLTPEVGHRLYVFSFEGQVKGFVSEFVHLQWWRHH